MAISKSCAYPAIYISVLYLLPSIFQDSRSQNISQEWPQSCQETTKIGNFQVKGR